jgi:UDP-glucose 4-epimerase
VASILVIDGAGYVGSVCCFQLLERGHEVTVVDDLSTGHAAAVPEGARFRQLDIEIVRN